MGFPMAFGHVMFLMGRLTRRLRLRVLKASLVAELETAASGAAELRAQLQTERHETWRSATETVMAFLGTCRWFSRRVQEPLSRCWCSLIFVFGVWIKIRPTGIGPQILVHVFTYRSIL